MNPWAPVAIIAIFLLVAQTVGFGLWSRRCDFGLDFSSQIRHNARIVNYSGHYNVSLSDRCLRNPLEC